MKTSLLQFYRKYYDTDFIRKYGQNYTEIVRGLEKQTFYQGPKQYISKEEVCQLCTEYIQKYGSQDTAMEFKNALKTKIRLYTVEELEQIISVMETDSPMSGKLSKITLCLEEAKELLETRGTLFYINKDC